MTNQKVPGIAGLTAFLTIFSATVAVSAGTASALPQSRHVSADVVPAEARISPEELAKTLQSASAEKPLILYVGFHVLYTQARIPGAEDVGPGARNDGIEKLRKRAETLSRKKLIVLYCGCCPWQHCPNVGPAYVTLHKMGFTRVKVLYIMNNLGRDWVYKGYPVEKGM